MATIELTSAHAWRTAWPLLTPDQIAAYVASGDLSLDFHATTNQDVLYRTYSGNVALRVVYRAFGEVVSPNDAGWLSFAVKPETAYLVTGLILQQESEVLIALIGMNGGKMPDIKGPIIAQPVDATPIDNPE